MARILAFDYGAKRTGIACTDPDQMISTAIGTITSNEVISFLTDYLKREKVELFVVGYPKTLQNTPAESAPLVDDFITKLKSHFKEIPVAVYDERFTSKIAFRTMIAGGLKKMDRRNKATIDQVSAVIILQDYMEWRMHQE